MPKIDLIDFITSGSNLNGIKLNEPLQNVVELSGKPIEKIGNKQAGFLQYDDGLRYGYFENEIDELAILFEKRDKYSYLVVNDYNEEIIISGLTQIHDFIYMLNTKKIKWRCVDEKNTGAFIMEINNKVYVFFDLYTGCLNKIFIGRR